MTSSPWSLTHAILALISVTMTTTPVIGGEAQPATHPLSTPLFPPHPSPTDAPDAPANAISSSPNGAVPVPMETQPPTDEQRMVLDTTNLDLDENGCIAGQAELDAFRRQVARALAGTSNSRLRAQSIVHRADINRDGRICWCDFITIYLHDRTNGGRHSFPFLVLPDTVMFSQLDSNKDGVLSGTERLRLMKEFSTCLPLPHAQSIVNGMDSTIVVDGAISLGEFAGYLKNPPPFRPPMMQPRPMLPPRPWQPMQPLPQQQQQQQQQQLQQQRQQQPLQQNGAVAQAQAGNVGNELQDQAQPAQQPGLADQHQPQQQQQQYVPMAQSPASPISQESNAPLAQPQPQQQQQQFGQIQQEHQMAQQQQQQQQFGQIQQEHQMAQQQQQQQQHQEEQHLDNILRQQPQPAPSQYQLPNNVANSVPAFPAQEPQHPNAIPLMPKVSINRPRQNKNVQNKIY